MIALAAADLTTFATIGDAALLTFDKIPSASLTAFPLIKSRTKRALRGVTRTSLATAFAEVTFGFAGSSTFLALTSLAGASFFATSFFGAASFFTAAGFFSAAGAAFARWAWSAGAR